MKSKNIYLSHMGKQLCREEGEGDESAFERFEEIILMFAEDELERTNEQRDVAYMLTEEAEEERLQSFRWFYQRLNGKHLECICDLRDPWDWDEPCEVCGKDDYTSTCGTCGKGGYGDIPCRCDYIQSYSYPRWRGLHSEASY